ncbi:MAG: hypothetical protein AAF512_07380 [Pseudomonadota bacterium]
MCIGIEENRAVTAEMIRQTEKELVILTRDFTPVIYEDEECFEALEDLALRSRYSYIRVLIQDTYSVTQHGHRILELGKRLSSYFEFRRPAEKHRHISQSFLVADDIGVIHREYADALKTEANFCHPMMAKERLGLFNTMWDEAESDPNFRFLSL